jgi:hypothetical protein
MQKKLLTKYNIISFFYLNNDRALLEKVMITKHLGINAEVR